MSEADEALRELAANRGCKLVKSRVRTPGRRDYGKFGLKDAKTGREVFGFGERASPPPPAEIEAFLRGDAAATWKSSVGKVDRRSRMPAQAEARAELSQRSTRSDRSAAAADRRSATRSARAESGGAGEAPVDDDGRSGARSTRWSPPPPCRRAPRSIT